MRFAACVEYNGGNYAGWQSQAHAPSVQAEVEAGLGYVANHRVSVVCAGRTDAGVHALGQICHFDAAERPARAYVLGANARLPADVSVHWAQPVTERFHARHDARWREYRYLIWNHPARSALFAGKAAPCRYRLDAEIMHRAAQTLLGEQDFSAFRAAGCQSRTPWRRLYRLDVARRGDFVIVTIIANAFVHHMVRNLLGTLMVIGQGLQPVAWAHSLLIAGDRRMAGATAPACGLYLWRVRYPRRFRLPERSPPDLLLPIEGGC